MRLLALGLDPRKLIDHYGTIGLFLIVFAESGLFFGFFLPGDALLFTAGLLVATHVIHANIVLIVLGIIVASVLGNQVGYFFGRRVGPELFDKPKSRIFNPKYVTQAHEFFERNGSKTIVLARFVPFVRTFAPIVAGVAGMSAATFVAFNVAGGVLWGGGVTLLGFALGKRYEWMGNKIDVLAPVIVLISLTPIAIEYLRHRRRASS